MAVVGVETKGSGLHNLQEIKAVIATGFLGDDQKVLESVRDWKKRKPVPPVTKRIEIKGIFLERAGEAKEEKLGRKI